MKKPRVTKRPTRARKRASTPDPLVDHRTMEKMMADLTRVLQTREFSSVEEMNDFLQHAATSDLKPPAPTTPVERAQDLMYEAWSASGERRVALARKALEISADCADAYVLLAEEAATSPEQAKELYEQGVAAGERAFGPEFFRENAGHFWGILETRPYMRAREGLAHLLWGLGERARAVEHFEEMLRLNPGDNQGIRYVLARHLLTMGDDARLGRLLEHYQEDASAEWMYTRALRLFRVQGESDAANDALTEALETNAAVALFLFGLRELPDSPPQYYSPGDENEAALYVGYSGSTWLETPGAIDWFAAHLERTLSSFEKTKAVKDRARPAKARAKKAAPAAGAIYQLKVTLRNSKPPIWRRLLVPASTKLSKLHDILQIAMGWTDSHLHMFSVGEVNYGVPSDDDWIEMLDERKATLAQVLPRAKSRMVYEYDFGDSWEHEILVEKVLDAEPNTTYPVCVKGKRTCPPEDCGGVWGYDDFLEAIKNPAHPEHDAMLEWVGYEFDSEAFDVEEINDALASLRR
jgi:tetratricopeptide (TPR) repeat protein